MMKIFNKFINLKTILMMTISILWSLKTIYFVFEMDLSPHKKYILISSIGIACIITAMLFLKRSLVAVIVSILVYLIISFLLYADVIYERYYGAILSIELSGQAGQIDDVFDSVISLIHATDIFYWIDIPFLIILFIIFNKKVEKTFSYIASSILIFIGTGIILLIAFIPLKEDFSDQYKVALSGVLSAHVYNTYHSLTDKSIVVNNTAYDKKTNKLSSHFNEKYKKIIKSDSFGRFKGKNVIMIQAESLNTFPLNLKIAGTEVTPTLNELIKTSNYYPNTFLQIGRGNTSDAEFVANNSIYPMSSQGIYRTYPGNDYLSLPVVLNQAGYSTSATHGNTPEFWNRKIAYQNQGFEEFYHKNHNVIDDKEIIGLGISDRSIFNQMLEIYKNENKPFYNFIVTLSVHRPFNLPKDYQKLNLPKEFNNTTTGDYLQSVNYFDRSLSDFIKGLKDMGIWEDTIFVLYGDHYGLLPDKKDELKTLIELEFNQKERFRVPLIIHYPKQDEGKVNNIVTSQMDIYPTLSTLLGIERPLPQFLL